MCNTSNSIITDITKLLLLWQYIGYKFKKWCILLMIYVILPITSGRNRPFLAEPCIDCKSFSQWILSPHGACITYLLYRKLTSLNVLRNSRWQQRWRITWVGNEIRKLVGAHHAIPFSLLMWPRGIHIWQIFSASLYPEKSIWKNSHFELSQWAIYCYFHLSHRHNHQYHAWTLYCLYSLSKPCDRSV